MQDFPGKVAVVTGAASGIGRALAHRFAREGMKIVLADVEAGALEESARAIRRAGAEALAVQTDVARAEDVEELASRTIDAFGAVHVVCNNAGVAISGPVWTHTLADWEWVLGVNLWGVIHGVRVFTPILLAQGVEAHIVNTASMAGLTCVPNMAIYGVSKHGVVALSETLHHELALLGSPVKVSVLCPGFVSTRIRDSARNRPAHFSHATPPPARSAEADAAADRLLASGLAPDSVADAVLDAIRAECLYVFPAPELKARIRAHIDDILADHNPRPSGPEGLPQPSAPKH
jgi:NAD(P)-dependent dehydrogenase (short-subunit alcohol dehydrogenase family)